MQFNLNVSAKSGLTCALILLAHQGSAAEKPSIRKNQSASVERPNVIVIMTDDQGWGDVSYIGTKDIRTPHIDNLASEGIVFNRFYANSPVCSPTRAAFLTGRYPSYVGVPGVIRTDEAISWGYFDPAAVTLGDMFSQAGYQTALIGKWHLGLESPNLPNERGFQHFKGFLGDMMEDYWTHLRNGQNFMRHNDEIIEPKGHATDLFTAWAVEYIRSQKDSNDPFFLFLAHFAPHDPVQPPKDWLQKVKEREPLMSERRAALVALIEHMDDGIGQVVSALKEAGLYENTLIFFTSDNGGLLQEEANTGPFRNGKGSIYEGGLLVPAIAVWKKQIAAGSVNPYKGLVMDLFPTLLDACEITVNHPIEGISFLPVLLGKEMIHSDRHLFFSRREGGAYNGLTIQAVQWNDWKLLQNSPFEPMELYFLGDDPYERNNLILARPEVRRTLSRLLMDHIQKGGQTPWQKQGVHRW
jgi:arylsulfatase A-like enzyme